MKSNAELKCNVFLKLRFLLGIVIVGVGVALSAGSSTQAQTPVFMPSQDQIVASLSPAAAGPLVTQLGQAGQLAALQPSQPILIGYDFPAFSFSIEFDAGGSMLTTNGMTVLRAVAAALNDPALANSTFQVGAHVVQAGSINSMPISSRRARVVVEHLTTFYGIPPHRLVPVGYGNGKLVDMANPSSPANERIEFVNVDAMK